jgi:hypothetical protein
MMVLTTEFRDQRFDPPCRARRGIAHAVAPRAGLRLAQAQSIEPKVEPRLAEDITVPVQPRTASAIGYRPDTTRPPPGKMALAPRQTISASPICASRL